VLGFCRSQFEIRHKFHTLKYRALASQIQLGNAVGLPANLRFLCQLKLTVSTKDVL
jgi:hypothetical protein